MKPSLLTFFLILIFSQFLNGQNRLYHDVEDAAFGSPFVTNLHDREFIRSYKTKLDSKLNRYTYDQDEKMASIPFYNLQHRITKFDGKIHYSTFQKSWQEDVMLSNLKVKKNGGMIGLGQNIFELHNGYVKIAGKKIEFKTPDGDVMLTTRYYRSADSLFFYVNEKLISGVSRLSWSHPSRVQW